MDPSVGQVGKDVTRAAATGAARFGNPNISYVCV